MDAHSYASQLGSCWHKLLHAASDATLHTSKMPAPPPWAERQPPARPLGLRKESIFLDFKAKLDLIDAALCVFAEQNAVSPKKKNNRVPHKEWTTRTHRY